MRVIPNLQPDVGLAERLFDQLREASFDGVGVTRDAYGPGERAAHALVRTQAEALGLAVDTDAVGNLYACLPGTDRSAPRIVVGSHLDSVRQGGNFDGAAGVLAGLSAVSGLVRSGFQPARDIVVMAIRAEEAGAWFPTSYPGSRAALGRLKPEELQVKRADTGRTLAQHIQDEGFDPAPVERGDALLDPVSVAAFVEVHIEQGPVLDLDGIPVGIVTGIPGSRRWRSARLIGVYGHSGAVPRRFRSDAVAAFGELVHRTDEAWGRLDAAGRDLVATFCTMGTLPQAGFTKIAGEVAFSLDVRSVDLGAVDALYERIDANVAEIEARTGVRLERGSVTGSVPAVMDASIRQGLAAAAVELGIEAREMASGGGHDAAAFVAAGVPAAMLFVRNQNGSHTPDEAMRIEDFDAATQILTRWLSRAAG